jgi:hypothetical protein
VSNSRADRAVQSVYDSNRRGQISRQSNRNISQNTGRTEQIRNNSRNTNEVSRRTVNRGSRATKKENATNTVRAKRPSYNRSTSDTKKRTSSSRSRSSRNR